MTPMETADLAIIDPCCLRGYCPDDLRDGALGGTEATVLRVTGMLRQQMSIVHYQKGRKEQHVGDAGHMYDLGELPAQAPAPVLIVINSWKLACRLRRTWPQTTILLWLHNFPGRHNRAMGKALSDANIPIVCVSHSQRRWVRQFLSGGPLPQMLAIHNPVDDALRPDATRRDPSRLLFASSPHKGLRQVFAQFAELREHMPELTLAVADPGYLAWDTGPFPDRVRFLGKLPHHALITEMRKSLCLFYPQDSFAETFGLVMAEANAVGTPVLVQRGLGANDEVIGDPRQCLDRFDAAAVADRLREWQSNPPSLHPCPEFRLSAVAHTWEATLSRLTALQPLSEVA